MCAIQNRSLFLLCVFAFGLRAFASEQEEHFQKVVRPLLTKYCLDCHNAEKHKGDLDLTGFQSVASIQAEFKTWQLVLQQVEDEEMPPKKPLPSGGEREMVMTSVREMLESIDWSQHRGIAHLTLPRLTKAEYNNTLRDLIGVDFQPANQLLADGQGLSGFTNDRDALFISPALAEQLFDAADYALQAALDLRGKTEKKRFEAEKMLMTERSSVPQDLPGSGGFGYSLAGAGQRTLYDEITVPASGWYRFKVRHVGIGGDSGMRLRIDNEVRHDFYCVDESPQVDEVELLLTTGTHQMTWNIELPRSLRLIQKAASAPVKKRRGKSYPVFSQADAAPKVRTAATVNAPQLPVPEGASAEISALVSMLNRNLVSMQMRLEYLRAVTPDGNPSDLRSFYNLLPERTQGMVVAKQKLAAAMKVTVQQVDRLLLESNREKIADNQKVLADSLAVLGLEYDPQFLMGNAVATAPKKPTRAGAPGVDWIEVEGPIVPQGAMPERVASLFKTDARAALGEFLPRAFRRPLREGEVDRHLRLYEKSIQRGESHDQALKLAFAAALTSPKFLFRDELGADGATFTLNDHQLASRLSYFLWMTMPDDELRTLADAGKLHEDATLRSQVKRMIADPKLRTFTRSFLGQWLDFAGLGTEHVPDAKKFQDFTPSLAEAMKLEPILVFENLLRSGGSLTQLLDSSETVANEELAAFYGLGNVTGTEMRPVKWVDDHRGGLLGMAAVLTASATPNRTSPVLRGKWVLENLLGRKLPEPPANAGQLDDKAGERGLTLREELAAHRRNETCAACHDKIDPVGFGLENFDAIGRFREMEAGKPVDATGALPGGLNFNGPAEFRQILKARHEDEFIANVTRRITSFALGRVLNAQDEGLMRLLLAELKTSGNRADALVEAIVLSEAFRVQGSAVEK